MEKKIKPRWKRSVKVPIEGRTTKYLVEVNKYATIHLYAIIKTLGWKIGEVVEIEWGKDKITITRKR